MSVHCPQCGAVAGYGHELGHRSDCPSLNPKSHLKLVNDVEKLKCPGVGRDAGNDKSLCFYFSRKVTDDEMRFLHEVVQRAVACVCDGRKETTPSHPEGYSKLPDGVRCRCLKLWLDPDGIFWCCRSEAK